jgi:hypothetical protein
MRAAEQRDVAIGHVRGMYRSHVCTKQPHVGQYLGGRHARRRNARRIFGGLLRHMKVYYATETRPHYRCKLVGMHGANAVRRKPHRPSVATLAQRIHTIEPLIDAAITESTLFR